MPHFQYNARTSDGQATQGVLEAASTDAVVSQLLDRGITPIAIKPAKAPGEGEVQFDLSKIFGPPKVTATDLIMFCRQMFTITKAGIPLVRGLRGLAAGMKHPHFKEVIHEVANRLEAGSSLSNACARFPKVFSRLFVSMISVGESTGSLDAVFKQMAFYMERDEETRKSIKSATRYPSFVIIALAIAITVVNIFVIPRFAEMFEEFGSELPLVTKILVGTSNVFVHHWWALLIGLAVSITSFIIFVRSPEGAIIWGKQRLKMPIVGDIIHRASMARYCRSFSLMLRAGVPLNQALNLCARGIDNPYLFQKIENIRRGIERGESLLHTHAQSKMLSPLVIQMIAVGEESGQVEELLSEVSDFYEREVDYDLKKMSDRIEPILIVIMAVFVAILALGIFLPMWDLYTVQKQG